MRIGAAGGIIAGEHLTSYAALSDGAGELAAWLAKRGIGAGAHVGLLAGNGAAIVAMYYAVWGIGAVAVPISARSTSDEAALLLEHGRAAALLCDEERAEVAREAGKRTEVAVYSVVPLSPRERAGVRGAQPGRARLRGTSWLRGTVLVRGATRRSAPPRPPRPHDLASITYTSGTTGSPKGVMITHGNFLWSALACAQARGDRQETVGAVVSAVTHTPVLVSHVLCRILLGSTIVVFPRFDAAAVLAAVERHRITDLSFIAGMVFDVLAAGNVPAGVRRIVEKVAVGGAPTPMSAKRALAEMFDRAEIIEAYGQSESTASVTMTRGKAVFERAGTAGRANPHVAVRIRRPDGTFAAPDEEGEVVIGGPTVMRGYYRNRAATAQALREGWLHTGDRGRLDADGYLYLTGRIKDLIITGGENVAPREVEDVLRRHPDVADVAVIGTPHARWGEQVTAVVVRRPGASVDGEALAEFAGRSLSGFKKPRRVEFVDRLPRNAARKVLVNELKERFG